MFFLNLENTLLKYVLFESRFINFTKIDIALNNYI